MRRRHACVVCACEEALLTCLSPYTSMIAASRKVRRLDGINFLWHAVGVWGAVGARRGLGTGMAQWLGRVHARRELLLVLALQLGDTSLELVFVQLLASGLRAASDARMSDVGGRLECDAGGRLERDTGGARVRSALGQEPRSAGSSSCATSCSWLAWHALRRSHLVKVAGRVHLGGQRVDRDVGKRLALVGHCGGHAGCGELGCRVESGRLLSKCYANLRIKKDQKHQLVVTAPR